MSFSMQKLRSLLPGQHASYASTAAAQRHSVSLEPEIGFQITIETTQPSSAGANNSVADCANTRTTSGGANLNVHLIGARHLPALFGFKVVQGYLIKVKLFPGSKRLDSSIQTNSWPKFNENFKFPLAPDIKPSLKHSTRRGSSKTSTAELYSPEELFAGQFVVFTVYALLELPPQSFNRLNKTYRSLRDKSSNFVQKMVESSNAKDDKNERNGQPSTNDSQPKSKRKPSDAHSKDAMPPLTISEARRNIGSVTCYLEPKLFQRNARSGFYTTEELWLPIKDITTTVNKTPNNNNNNLTNAAKGVVELTLEVKDLSEHVSDAPLTAGSADSNSSNASFSISPSSTATTTTTTTTMPTNGSVKWQRMTSEVKRKMGISNNNYNSNNSSGSSSKKSHQLLLCITTARMRCSNKAKDELEATAGSVYVKTSVFEHGIYVDAWKSSNFYPSLSTKWNVGDAATLTIPLQSLDNLNNILIRTTLATKTKMGKKLVLGTVLIGATAKGSGAEHLQLLRESSFNELVPMWHSYQ